MDIFEKQQKIESIKGIVRARWFIIAIVLFLGFALKTKYFGGWAPGFSYLKMLGITVFVSAYNFAYWLYLRQSAENIKERPLKIVAVLQIIIDQVIYTLIYYSAGTIESISFSLYYVTILTASSLYKTKGIVLTGLSAAALHSGLLIAEYNGLLPHVGAYEGVIWFGNIFATRGRILTFIFYMGVMIFFSAFLSGLLRKRETRLREQRDQLEQVAQKLIQRETALNEAKKQQEEALRQVTEAKKGTEESLREATEVKKKAEEARIATLNVLEDVDEARKAQEIEKNKVESVIKSLTDGLVVLDQSEKIILTNKQAEEILNIAEKEMIGRKLEEIDKPEIKKLSQLILSESGQIVKKEIAFADAEEKILEITTNVVKDSKGKIFGRAIILHDITREKAVEKMKSEFVSIAAHQLRTPLSATKWILSLTLNQEAGPLNEEQKQILQKGYQSNERMIRLVNDLLDVARIEEGRFIYKLSRVSFSDLVEDSINIFQPLIKTRGLKIKFEKPKKICMAEIDKENITLALENLIENAIHYSPNNSSITISLICDETDLTFMVKDGGIGIAKTQQQRIFGKFFRGDNAVRKETEGTGLGLFIVKNIINSHGGRIWFESEENKGSTFYFTLPLSKPETIE